jgi:hypothetical protein
MLPVLQESAYESDRGERGQDDGEARPHSTTLIRVQVSNT